LRVRLYRPAQRDIENVFGYIAIDNPRAAERVVARILGAIERLADSPRIGRPGRVSGTRELVITRTNYLAIYEIDGDVIGVVRVLHGRQNWPPVEGDR
jgi:addiction module RelE/StbE family toxin